MEEPTPSPEYLKGFNEGYLLGKNMPEIMAKLSTLQNETDRVAGLKDGYKEYVHEKARQNRPSYLKSTSLDKSIEKTKSKDRDKGLERE